MRTAKRITTACLTAIMIFQALAPSTEVFAQELDAVMEASVSAAHAAGNTARSVQDAVATALEDADQAASDDAATTPGADAGATEGGNGSTSTDGSQDSTTDGATNGDASTEGDASQDDTTAGDSATDEEQADDADADVDAQADVNYEYNTVDDLKKAIGESKVTAGVDGTVTQIVFANEADLIKISNTDPTVYKNAVISRDANTGGEFKLDSASVGNLKFEGFGSENVPFEGSLEMQGSTLAVSHTLYNNIQLSDTNRTVAVTWKGTGAQPVIASKINGNGRTLVANVTVANVNDGKSKLKSPLLGEADGVLTLQAAYSVDAGKTLAVDINSDLGNVGLLANTVKASASFTIAKLEGLPSSGTQTVATTKDGASAGGLIGLCKDGVTVSLANPIDLSNFTVVGKAASGGFIGKATKLTLDTDNKKFTCPATVGDASSQSSGGFIGDVSFASPVEFTNNDQIDTGLGVKLGQSGDMGAGGVFGLLDTTNGDVTISGGSYASKLVAGSGSIYGGLVGRVQDVTSTETPNNTLHIKTDGEGNRCSVDTTCSVAPRLAGGLVGWVAKSNNTGGVVIVDGADVTCHSPQVTGKNCGFGGVVGALDSGYSVGGRSRFGILDCGDIRVTADTPIACGAGIVGSAWNGVLRLRGTTDLSECKLEANGNTNQILRSLDGCSPLVFALGSGSDAKTTSNDYWIYKRPAAAKIDDLTYNQVIRLTGEKGKLSKDLIKLDKSTFYQPLCNLSGAEDAGSSAGYSWGRQLQPQEGKVKSGTYLINDADTFACIAMTVQTHGYFGGVFGIGTGNSLKNWYGNRGNTFLITSNIDLRGTGLEGLACDGSWQVNTFGGAVEGNRRTVTLAIGEPFGTRNDVALGANDPSEGNGKIYRHSRLGLFNAVGGGATANDSTAKVSNLTIDGIVNFDNGLAVDAGSLAATIAGNVTLSGVTCEPKLTCDDTFGNDVNMGGIAGSVRGAGTVSFEGGAKAQAIINTGSTLKGNTRIGGAIGYVADVAATVNVASLEIGGEIAASNSASGKKAQVGGFIGCIMQSTYKEGKKASSAEKNVSITGLSFSSFDMTVGKSGDAKNGAGGLLGYSWGNAVVTIGDGSVNKDANSYALKTTNASITANSSGELGGLVYAASGHWIINDHAIDLSGTTIKAENATTLGLLVGRGSKVAAGVYGSESYTGLYLEDRAYWGTAYNVSGITVTAFKVTTFDEWVGNGVKPGSKLMDGEWNTVVSLHTDGGTLNMSGKAEEDNSYKNRSAFGQSNNTVSGKRYDLKKNSSTRYYYNLDRAYSDMKASGNDYTVTKIIHLSTPQELLLWSACRYAPAEIQTYIAPGMTGENAGDRNAGLNSYTVYIDKGSDTSAGQKPIDLSGYSYYPAQPKGHVYVQNANIKFCYSDIKCTFANNKSNAAGTQHENMHCGLLRTINANLSVNNVTLGGTVGIAVNDGDTSKAGPGGTVSGALVCRYVSWSSGVDRQISINNLTLNGLAVDGVTDEIGYAPLLINEMQTHVKLNAKNISTTGYADNTKAATSLFGKLGVGSTADQVTAIFSLINLPSATDDSIFTRASLLESFGYGKGNTGSAVYTFFKADQTNDAQTNKVTFGKEIDANDADKNEYIGKQLWYYDEDGYGTDGNLVTVGSTVADKTGKSPKFGGYLPYVKKGKANESDVQYHEIKVNQRVPNLAMGCGTYGDPYAITKATEFNTVAEYINTQNPSDGWEVTIAANQEELCRRRSSSNNTDNEVTYVYNLAKKTWEKKTGTNTIDSTDTLDDATMHSYLQSAYYSIEPVDNKGNSIDTLVLDITAFQGLGNQGNPFRGVIVGNLRGTQKVDSSATIKIDNTGSTSAPKGLIPYSYGSVVSNLNIEYSGNAASIAHKKVDTSGVPGAFFGGVIGCIMGGDNIIDGVSVSASGGFSVAGTAGDKGAHLVPVGGYVGAIAGGGVIFRNSSNVSGALNKWHNAGTSLYDNPYVGRVIDGYAFSELAGNGILENTDRNYRVNNLDTTDKKCIETGETQGRYRGNGTTNNLAITTTVNDSQGLLVLSAIISSGAAGGSANTTTANESYGTYAGSRAYLGGNTSTNKKGYKFGNQNYGKVRNAKYDNVGQPASAATDFDVATKDDTLSPGSQNAAALDQTDGSKVNSPYLVSKYATWQTGNICAAQASGIDLRFVNTAEKIDYDMMPYGTGYTGLSGRYYSNACASNKGADRDRIVPFVATINGNGATIRVGSNGSDESDNGKKNPYDIQEYTDDDYKLTGVGALFGTVTYTSENVSESIGTPATDGAVATGNSGYTVQNLNFYDCNISLRYVSYSEIATVDNNIATVATDSANEVGVGLLAGTTANANSLGSYGKYSTVDMTKCSVNGPTNVGGLIGASGYGARSTDKSDTTWVVNRTGGQSSPVKLYDCSYAGMTVNGGENVGGFVGKLNAGSQGGVWTTKDKNIAKDSTIESPSGGSRVGGIIGVNGGEVYVNTNPVDKKPAASGKATIKNVALGVPANAGASGGVGGFIGKAENNVYAHNLVVTSDTTTKSMFGAPSASNLKNVGGIAGNITGGSEFKFNSCEVSNIDIESREVSGGISGNITNSPNVTCSNIVISGNNFSSSYAGGINGSLGEYATPTFNITNTVIRNNVFINRSNAWESPKGSNNKSRSGGLGGDGKGTFNLANVLFDSNDFQGKDGQGIFFGDAKSGLKIYAAGIDIKPGNGKARNDLPPLLFDTTADQSTVKQINKVSYVAFADYKDTFANYKDTLAALGTNTTLYSDDDASENKTVAASPYVTTSPISKIAVRVSGTDTTDRYLFGDGANVKLAETIKGEAKTGRSKSGSYAYNNIGGRDDSGAYQNNVSGFDENSPVGTFNGNNESKKVDKDKDFDVLVLSGGDTTTVESYLNIVTNGGYSDAKRLNRVTANIETFTLNENKHFVKDAAATPTVSIENKNSTQIKFRASGSAWDNEKGRFNLLTVTFTEAGQSYKVQVPIIVKRMLEIDFTATFVEGSNFKSSNYNGRGANAHVLIGGGETMTGYLTWTYGQAYGTPTSYGWNTYLASGGSMGPLQKKIKFLGDGTKGTLPAGTQLTLVDTANNNKEYHYTVGANGADSVSLSDFTDANKKNYAEPWLSEEVGVTANEDNTNGTWVDSTEADATAKAGGKYYRPKTAEDVKNNKKPLYTLSVPAESPVTENFYLVVRTPSNSASVNGYTATEIGNKSVNTRINYTLRTGNNKLDEDDHHNTASTYSIASNYTHNLVDKESGTKQMTVRGTTYPLDMHVCDTIKFGEQEYTSSDTLYYQLDSSLVNYEVHDEVSKAAGAHGYPTGTQGTYSFYVMVGNSYYTWNGSGWNDPVTTKTPVVAAKTWSSTTGGDMSLVLADANGKAIDLSGIREIAKSQKSEFVITMKASLTMTEPACQAGIIASQKGGSDKYTKPNYRAYLSTHADTLSTSSNSAYNDGGAGYFRMDVGSSTIALEASKKSQLGINIDDLKSADGEIALVGTYDFSRLNGADAMISSADTVTYTLSLQRRNDKGTYDAVTDISKYITVLGSDKLDAGTLSDGKNSYVFTDTKAANGFATRDGSSLAFKHAFRIKVNTNVEGKSQFYANYRLVLTATMSGDGVNDTPVNANNLDGYQHSDYVTYTLARINTEGIQHGSTTN